MDSKKLWKGILAAFALALLASTGGALAQAEGAEQGELPPGMTAEQMAAWQESMTPGAEHERLAQMAGTWDVKATMWMAPDAPPAVSVGTSERKMELGGRVLSESVKAEMMGEAFEGFGLTGYDKVSNQYWGTWNDSMGTGLMTSTGSCSEDGTCEFTGTWNDPIVDGPKTVRMTMKSEGDREVHVMYDTTPDGKEFKAMELVYTRVEK